MLTKATTTVIDNMGEDEEIIFGFGILAALDQIPRMSPEIAACVQQAVATQSEKLARC